MRPVPRVFLALPVSPEVGAELKAVRRDEAALRWTDPAGYHITLRFLGEIVQDQLEAARQAADAAAARCAGPLRLKAEGVGSFPNARQARVIWAGVAGETDRLRGLWSELERQLASRGFPPERRAFSPHVTLARSRGGPLPSFLQACSDRCFGEWEAAELLVMESRLGPAGARYAVRHRARLGGPAAL